MQGVCKERAREPRTERDIVGLELLGVGGLGVGKHCVETWYVSHGWRSKGVALNMATLTDGTEALSRGRVRAVVDAGDAGTE